MHTAFRSGRLVRDPQRATRRDAFRLSKPLLLWAVVLAVTMLSFYVHLLNEQMVRAQGLGMAPAALPPPAKAGVPPRKALRITAVPVGDEVATVR